MRQLRNEENATAPLKGSYSDGVSRPSRAGKLMAHEWGHASGVQRGSNHLDTSVQLGNTYLRAKGAGYYRTSHGTIDHSPGFNPNRRVRRFGF